MDFLLDPNLAYLILLSGILLAMFALVTPGTGVLEIASLFCFLLAGYEIYKITIHWWALAILAVSAIPFAYALKTKNKIFLGASIGCLMIGSVFLFHRDAQWISVNPILAVVASAVLGGAFWFVALKFMQTLTTRPTHDLDSIVGKIGEARSVIHHDGSVYVNGELWSARSEKKLAQGSTIRVLQREGFVLLVEKVE